MADITLSPRSALAPFLRKGSHGAKNKAGVILREINTCALAELTAFQGQNEELKSVIITAFGVILPMANRTVSYGDVTFISIGPGKWLVTGEGQAEHDLVLRLEKAVGAMAAVVDQSDARALVEVSGDHARLALAKGVMIDLDPAAFKTGHSAVSFAVQFWITLWQINHAPLYRITVFRSMGRDLVHWLESSSVEFGLEIV